jgi:alkylhydroperoxidase/carboxymuconolactone decarboxylase family protein YurZ
MSDSDDLAARLRQLRDKRGYLLPHHGLMAITAPGLLAAYDATYSALALEPRVLSRHDHEFVWLATLIATDEALATHHIARFRDAGGKSDEIEVILALTALALGVGAYRFVDRHWLPHLPGLDPASAYLAAFRGAAVGAPVRLAHLAAACVHTCKASWDALAWQIGAAYADAVPEAELAEALSLTMFPGSVPNFVEAARVWRDLIVAGKVSASADFRAWAEMAGQGGYDEAAGTTGDRR